MPLRSFYPQGNCRAYNEGKVCPFKRQGNSGGKAAPAQLTSKQQKKADKKAEKAKDEAKEAKKHSKREKQKEKKRAKSEGANRAPLDLSGSILA